MKYFLLVIALIAAVVAALLFVPVKNGRPLVGVDQVQDVVEQSGIVMGDEPQAAVLYRWKDSAGKWQYGDHPPPGVPSEMVEAKSVKTVPAVEPE